MTGKGPDIPEDEQDGAAGEKTPGPLPSQAGAMDVQHKDKQGEG